MKKNKRGFTLIELLVVVLIIGILAAVAVPQYNKAVKRARYREKLSIITPLATAAQEYYLTHGTHPTSLDDLVINMPEIPADGGCLKNGICVVINTTLNRLYVVSGYACMYYRGNTCNGYVYQMTPYGSGSIIAPSGLYCYQALAWAGPDGMCKGEIVKSDANGTLHRID